MAITGISDLCVSVERGPGEVCVVLPGGTEVCAAIGLESGDLGEIGRGILGQVNTALAPLSPFFTIFDCIVAIFDCINAIKDAFGPPPNPAKIVQCLQGLAEAVSALLALHPALSIPITVKSILNAVIIVVRGLRGEIASLVSFAEDIAAAATRADQLNNFELRTAVDCAQDQIDFEFENLSTSAAPIVRLFKVINLLLKLAGLPCIQVPFGAFDALSAEILKPLDLAIQFLETVRDLIPAPDLILGALPAPTDPCD